MLPIYTAAVSGVVAMLVLIALMLPRRLILLSSHGTARCLGSLGEFSTSAKRSTLRPRGAYNPWALFIYSMI